jgi:ankyrin repeat protein
MLGDDNSNILEAASSFLAAALVTEEMVTQASRTGNLEQLQVYARQGVRVKTGRPLCFAASGGFIEMAKCLLQELGANVNERYGSHTALAAAANQGNLDMVRYLIENGASTNIHEASSSLVAAALVTEAMVTQASANGDSESLRQWVRQGVRVRTAGPLNAAVEGGFLEVMELLVTELGADANKADEIGMTPLLNAGWRDDYEVDMEIMQCLVELGADVDLVMDNGETILIYAAYCCEPETMECLVEVGASTEVMDGINGNTALLVTALQGFYHKMQYLIEHAGANMEAVNNYGETMWDLLTNSVKLMDEDYGFDPDRRETAQLIALLRVLVLRDAPPPALVALLPPEPARVVQEGARLLAQLPAYLVRRQAFLNAHCSVLPPELRALVHGYMELTTTEDFWATLGAAP